MRVLVCGGRDFDNYQAVETVLNSIPGISLIINGGAKGADALSSKWAKEHKVACLVFPALWNKEGKAAGPLRNVRMLEEGQPQMVVAFPGGKGTAHMLALTKQADIPYWNVVNNTEIVGETEERGTMD
jgi:hypothetical protein